MKTLVIIPAYNEEKNIKSTIHELKIDFSSADILIVNDCSLDNTLEILKKTPGIAYLNLPINLGYSGALQCGFKYAMEKEYDYVIQFDGDGQHIAVEAANLLQILLTNNVDIVIGSRFKNKTDYHHSIFRKIGTSLFRHIIKRLCKIDMTDPTSGLQVLNRSVFSLYAGMNKYPEFPDANLIIEMLLQNYRILELPVKMRNREFGESMHGGVFKPFKYMVKMMYAILLILFKRRVWLRRVTQVDVIPSANR